MVIEAEGLFMSAWGRRKADYCSCFFRLWARDVATADAARGLLTKAGAARIDEPMFVINRAYPAGNDLEIAEIEEVADGPLMDDAYPELKGGLNTFIESYLDAKEIVLVLQGPPGTGKTRLIRAILGELRAGTRVRRRCSTPAT
jgi:hypothetical protein